ncbi:metallophosphoesterase [Longispora albida]|uniref:metallophosphoesterase n=1 Tax=Longispora albida TaxID=203523 RepID=UPI0003669633|nr:metallophosphoesterase [Longispora albida]
MDATPPVRKQPVAWFAPGQLAGTALRVVLAQRFGAYLDKRELQAMFDQEAFHHEAGGELWLDYVADVGDGFDPTYSVAYLLAQPSLDLGEDLALPRGDVLVMGGDQVYPAGSAKEYRERCEGPYTMAFPDGAGTSGHDTRSPSLYAIPGNHDWYDGLTAFLRLFGKGKHFGGWRSPQSRSYFALKLPNGWWLYAMDFQFEAYIDEPQLVYFQKAARELKPGDRVIITTPAPTWVHTAERTDAYDTIRYFRKKVIGDRDVQVRVHLSGDTHHYARYGEAFITCGGGGGYLAGTHNLPEKIIVRDEVQPLNATYPSTAQSKRFTWGAFWRIPLRNPTFALLLGTIHTLLLLAFVSSRPRILTMPVLAMIGVVIGATWGFTALEAKVRKKRHHILSAMHAAAHLLVALTGMYIWNRLPFVDLPPPWATASAVLYLLVVSAVAVEVVAAHLVLADRFKVNSNELFAGQGIIDAKCFLRMHFAPDGSLTIYPIGLARSGRRWIPNLGTGGSVLLPETQLRPHLIEPPIKIL